MSEDMSRLRGVSLLLVGCLLLGSACSSGSSGGSSADPCPIVKWWADTSGSVSKPSDAPESLDEAQNIADSLPDDEGQAFLGLYQDLASNMSDAAYTSEADSFEASYC